MIIASKDQRPFMAPEMPVVRFTLTATDLGTTAPSSIEHFQAHVVLPDQQCVLVEHIKLTRNETIRDEQGSFIVYHYEGIFRKVISGEGSRQLT